MVYQVILKEYFSFKDKADNNDNYVVNSDNSAYEPF